MHDKPRTSNLWHVWRYYGFGKDAYKTGMDKAFSGNMEGLVYTNFIFSILMFCYAMLSAALNNDALKAVAHCIVAGIALALYIFARRAHRQKKVFSKRATYALIALCYANIMTFGTYVGVWINRSDSAVSFSAFMIVALLLFATSPTFTLAASSCAFILFGVSAVLCKETALWIDDVANVAGTYVIGLVANWAMNRYRLSAVLSEMELREERDKWFSQSTIDPLTQLNNRRAFAQRFQRYLTSHRDTDKWLAVAVIDIDYFKEYNDHYGHLKGDELICAIGKVLNDLQASRGVFAARTGGDEFVLLWLAREQAGVDDADEVVSCLREKMEALQIPHIKSKVAAVPNLTISIGVYVARLDLTNTSDLTAAMNAIYDSADRALYEAKRAGKNRAVIKRESVAAENAGGGGYL